MMEVVKYHIVFIFYFSSVHGRSRRRRHFVQILCFLEINRSLVWVHFFLNDFYLMIALFSLLDDKLSSLSGVKRNGIN